MVPATLFCTSSTQHILFPFTRTDLLAGFSLQQIFHTLRLASRTQLSHLPTDKQSSSRRFDGYDQHRHVVSAQPQNRCVGQAAARCVESNLLRRPSVSPVDGLVLVDTNTSPSSSAPPGEHNWWWWWSQTPSLKCKLRLLPHL